MNSAIQGLVRLFGDTAQCRVSTETLNLVNELDNYTLGDWLIKEPFDSALHLRCSNKVKEWVVDMFILSCHGRLKAAFSGTDDLPPTSKDIHMLNSCNCLCILVNISIV